MSDEPEIDTRPKRNPHKKSKWEKSDKLIHGKKTSHKRKLDEIAEDDDEWQEYAR